MNVPVARLHPTKELLLETAVTLIDRSGPHGFTVEELLETSGISKGSMYHHFEDFNDVIESAQLVRFSRHVDEDSAAIARVMVRVNSREEMLVAVRAITESGFGPERAAARKDRAAIIGQARHSEKFAALLAREQERLTASLVDVARELQERGLLSRDINLRVLATFIQAYAFGRVLDDISENRLDDAEWGQMIDRVIQSILQ